MILPSPDDPGRAPVWDNYVVAQAVQATLGLIPRSALAVGVEVNGYNVRLRFQLAELTDLDAADMEDIVDGLGALLGDAIQVESAHEVRAERAISPRNGVRWIFLARS